jgi:hypothetical protein
MEAPLETPLAQLFSAEESSLRTDFRAGIWPRAFAVHHGDPRRLPSFFRRSELFDPRELRRVCPAAGVSVTHAGARFQVAMPDVGPAAVELLLRSDLTLSFTDVPAAIPEVRAWLDDLADELGIARRHTDLALFVSSSGQGLPCHFDAYDALVVQLHGTKRWRVSRAPALEAPVDRQYAPGTPPTRFHAAIMPGGLPETDPPDLAAVDLVPGSVLFVPRGTWHTTAAGAGLSVSASIFLNVPSIGALLVEQLAHVIAQDPLLRAPAVGFADARAGAAGRFAGAALAVGRHVGALSAQAAFEDEAPPDRLGQVIADTTRFLRDPSRQLAPSATGARAEDRDGVVRLSIVDSAGARPDAPPRPDVLVLPDAAVPLVSSIAERRGVFTAGAVRAEFPAFDRASIAGLLAELVRVGLLLLVPFGPLDGGS